MPNQEQGHISPPDVSEKAVLAFNNYFILPSWCPPDVSTAAPAPDPDIRQKAKGDLFATLFEIQLGGLKEEEDKAQQAIQKELKGLLAEPSYRETLLIRERAKGIVYASLAAITKDPTVAFRKKVTK